jgi:metal-responsive CopG/Arc/MetJ family transcriptional regulator
MPTEKPILTFAVDDELLERINDFRFENRIETKSEAIRMLLEKGLEDYEKKPLGKNK